MARAQATDPLHAFRFHARASGRFGAEGTDFLQGSPVGDAAEAGFTAMTTPEYTVEATDYREGTKTYAEKYPGIPTVNEITLSRGVSRKDTSFLGWIVDAIEGREYRCDIDIFHAHREGRSAPFNPANDFTQANSRRYSLRNAFPVRVKVAGDLDASTSDVSIAEMDVAFESFRLTTSDGISIGS